MKTSTFGFGAFVLAGVIVSAALQLHFVISWRAYYSQFPEQGYSSAMAAGLIPPWMYGSPRSMLVADGVLGLFTLGSLRFAEDAPDRAALALWIGTMLVLVGVWVSTPYLRNNSNLWPIDLVVLSFKTVIPFAFGAVLFAIGRRLQSVRHPHSF